MLLDALATLTVVLKIKHLHTLIHGEALREFETICVHMGNMSTTHINKILLGLGM